MTLVGLVFRLGSYYANILWSNKRLIDREQKLNEVVELLRIWIQLQHCPLCFAVICSSWVVCGMIG